MGFPVDNSTSARAARPTAFKPGQSGNPRGRLPGTRNRVTIDARDAATRLVDDPAYRAELLKRMIDGTAGALEPLMWFYAKGKPAEGVDAAAHGAFSELTNEKLRERLTQLQRESDRLRVR